MPAVECTGLNGVLDVGVLNTAEKLICVVDRTDGAKTTGFGTDL